MRGTKAKRLRKLATEVAVPVRKERPDISVRMIYRALKKGRHLQGGRV